MDTTRFFTIVPLAYAGESPVLTYAAPIPLESGQVVTISIGRRPAIGVVIAEVAKPSFKTKPVTSVLDHPPIPPDLMQLASWMADYYAATLSSVFAAILPTGITKSRREAKSPVTIRAAGLPPTPLTPDQQAAISAAANSPHSAALLQGVTGSGKTRVYLELAAISLARGRSVIVLVPEITLTPQIVSQFERVFGEVVLSSHSKLTEAKRHQIWTQAIAARQEKQARVIVGPRSALLMPVHDLGLIVIDECHESSYKQEQQPRYQAVPLAAARARITSSKLLLGSATPGLAELYLAKIGRIEHILMTRKINNYAHPEAKIIDMRIKQNFKLSKFIAQDMLDAVQATLDHKRQSLLYLNRRGSASSQVCGDCGNVTVCPTCTLPLTFHADLMRLICHHCNFRTPSRAVCSNCHGSNLRFLGTGTKRIEEEITHLFPSARIARLDRDSATLTNIKRIYAGLKSSEIDILIGTQMIAKGLDIPGIDTVGVINADTMLYLPDFTAAERTFQLLSQVSGRAGRGASRGEVFIQTYSPNHPAIVMAATNQFMQFADAELAQRRALNYPPYVYLLKLTYAAKTTELASQASRKLAASLSRQPDIQVVGPAPAFLEHQAGDVRWTITVKSKQRKPLVAIASSLPDRKWIADLDPINLL